MAVWPYGVYSNKTVPFRYRGRDYSFALSQEIFSSADIDTGSRLLLKVFSRLLDKDTARGADLPSAILDAGSGVGVLGVCAGKAIAGITSMRTDGDTHTETVHTRSSLRIRFQDRDALAREFTEYNALQNGLPADHFTACAEPLLAGPIPDGGYDLILTNIPAKAGAPVLEDFVRRSTTMLSRGSDGVCTGYVVMVAVNPLAEFFREKIAAYALPISEDAGPGHTVFVYTGGETTQNGMNPQERQTLSLPDCYHRVAADYIMEGTTYHLDTVYGAPGFDSPGGAIRAAARLITKTGTTPAGRVLIWEDEQGHFACWAAASQPAYTMAGRNVVNLMAAGSNLRVGTSPSPTEMKILPCADLSQDAAEIGENGPFDFIAAFPGNIAAHGNVAFWEGLTALAAPNAVIIVSLPSVIGERFDKFKPKRFTRLGELKRDGFRAMAYRSV
jgi:hypothetical protein